METLNLSLGSGIDYTAALNAAKEAVLVDGRKYTLFAWFDKERNLSGPQEVCSGETWKCARDYAEHHEADIRVAVNEDAYEFYFSRDSRDLDELDRDEVAAVHEGIATDAFENQQGG